MSWTRYQNRKFIQLKVGVNRNSSLSSVKLPERHIVQTSGLVWLQLATFRLLRLDSPRVSYRTSFPRILLIRIRRHTFFTDYFRSTVRPRIVPGRFRCKLMTLTALRTY